MVTFAGSGPHTTTRGASAPAVWGTSLPQSVICHHVEEPSTHKPTLRHSYWDYRSRRNAVGPGPKNIRLSMVLVFAIGSPIKGYLALYTTTLATGKRLPDIVQAASIPGLQCIGPKMCFLPIWLRWIG